MVRRSSRSLQSSGDPLSPAEVADLIASSLADRPDLTRLLGPLHMSFELHEDGMQVHEFYRWQRERLLELAGLVAEADPPKSTNGTAFDAIYRAQLIAAAVHPVSRPVGNLAVDLMAEDHQVFALDFEDEVKRTVLRVSKARVGAEASESIALSRTITSVEAAHPRRASRSPGGRRSPRGAKS